MAKASPLSAYNSVWDNWPFPTPKEKAKDDVVKAATEWVADYLENEDYNDGDEFDKKLIRRVEDYKDLAGASPAVKGEQVDSQQPSTVSAGVSGTGTSQSTSKESSTPATPKFKVGDKVKRVSCIWERFKNAPEVLTVTAVRESDGGIHVAEVPIKHATDAWDAEMFELVPRPKPKFKVGDNVVTKGCLMGGCGSHTGSIKAVDGRTYSVLIDVEGDEGPFRFKEDSLALIPQPAPKFKVGDKVRVVGGYSKSGNVRVVKGISSFVKERDCYIIWFETHPDFGPSAKNDAYEDVVELASEHKFKVGDRVRINDNNELPTPVGTELVVNGLYSSGHRYDVSCSDIYAYKAEWLDALPPLPPKKIAKLVGGPKHGEELEVKDFQDIIRIADFDEGLAYAPGTAWKATVTHKYQRLSSTNVGRYRYAGTDV